MPDYTSRAEELLKEIEAIQSVLPKDASKRLRQAVSDYIQRRNACLDDLLALLKDDSAGNKQNGEGWTKLCKMDSEIEGFGMC